MSKIRSNPHQARIPKDHSLFRVYKWLYFVDNYHPKDIPNGVGGQTGQSLNRANSNRIRQAHIKYLIKHRHLTVQEVLEASIPEWLEGLQLRQLIKPVYGIGPWAMDQLFYKLNVKDDIRLYEMTTSEKYIVITFLNNHKRGQVYEG